MSSITFKNNITKQITDYTLRSHAGLVEQIDFSVDVDDLDFIPENGEIVSIILTDLKNIIEGEISQFVLRQNKKSSLSIKIVSISSKLPENQTGLEL